MFVYIGIDRASSDSTKSLDLILIFLPYIYLLFLSILFCTYISIVLIVLYTYVDIGIDRGSSESTEKLDLNPPRGTRDFYPEDMRLRKWIFGQWRDIAESFG